MNLLNCLGVGQVANNKNSDTDEVFIYLPRNNPTQDGGVVAEVNEETVQYETPTGDVESSKTLSSNSEPAKWMSFESNRLTPPSVREGTKVRVYQYQGSNDYYWTLDGLDGTIKLDTVIWVFPASPNIDENTPLTPDNYYMVKMDTVGGKLEVITGKGNKEFSGTQTTYDFNNGYFGIQDDNKNMFVFNWKERSFNFANSDGSILSVDKRNFLLMVKDEGVIEADKSILIKTKDLAVLAENTIDMRTKTFSLDSDKSIMTARNGFDFFGDVKLNGSMLATDIIKSNIDVLSGNISGKGHLHGGVKSGGDSTAQPM